MEGMVRYRFGMRGRLLFPLVSDYGLSSGTKSNCII